MDFNKVMAKLEFVGSTIVNVEINSNMINIPDDVTKSFGLDIKCSQPFIGEDGKFGKILMRVDVELKDNGACHEPDTFKIIMEGMFKTSQDVSDEEFLELLNINGGAALYSVLRAKMEVLSAMTYTDGKVILPMVNIIQYFQELNEKK